MLIAPEKKKNCDTNNDHLCYYEAAEYSNQTFMNIKKSTISRWSRCPHKMPDLACGPTANLRARTQSAHDNENDNENDKMEMMIKVQGCQFI